MATPLDPDRWSDFASPKPPAAVPERSRAGTAAGADRQRCRQIADVLHELTLGGAVSFVVQCAQLAASGVDSDVGGGSRRAMTASELREVSVDAAGRIELPAGLTVSSEILLELLRETTRELSLPPVVARTILARPAPSLDRMADLLAEFANIGDLAAGGRLEHAQASPAQPSPTARRRPVTGATVAPPADAATANSSPRVAATAALPRRYVVAGGFGALGLLTVLALLAGGAAASPSESVARSPMNSSLEPTVADSAAGTGEPPEIGAAAPISWAGVLAELDRQRQRFFATGDATSLATYAKAGSPAQVRDGTAQRELVALGARATGMVSKIITVKPVAVTKGVAELDVTDELSGYQIVRIDTGAVIETRPARPVATWRVNLERVGENWQLIDSRAA